MIQSGKVLRLGNGVQLDSDVYLIPSFLIEISALRLRKMIFALFITCARSASRIVELTPERLSSVAGGDLPAFISYYSQSCGYSKLTNEEIEDLAECYDESDIVLGRFNCSMYLSKCKERKIDGYPTLVFYPPKDTNGEVFIGFRLSDDFRKFIEDRTHLKSVKPRQYIEEINSSNFLEKIKKNMFVLNTFYEKDDSDDLKNEMASLRYVAKMFQRVHEDIGFTKIACAENRDICNKYGRNNNGKKRFMVLFDRSGKNVEYFDVFSTDKILRFINNNCGTKRDIDGILDSSAGLIDDAKPLVTEFLESDDKKQIIEKMKKIDGTKEYVKAMERYVLRGEEQLKKDIFLMDDIISERKFGIAKLDEMKKRRNIFACFVKDLFRLMPPPVFGPNEL